MIVSSFKADRPGGLETTVCIIGAGAAGITLACELDGCGFPVLLIDAGGEKPDPAVSREIYSGTTSGRHPDPTDYRRIGFGGTTRIWGGRCVPYDPIDFEPRAHVPGSGWPIAYGELARHYPRALEYCHAGNNDFSSNTSIPEAGPTIPGLPEGGDLLTDCIERYSLPTDFGKRHGAQIRQSPNVTALLGARCLRLIRASVDGPVESVEVADRQGQRQVIRAKAFVLATGGIETPRLLFVSDPGGPGLGNAGDCLGRFYGCHFENVCAKLTTQGAAVAFSFEKTVDGVYARRKLQFTADAQRRHQLLNSAFRLHFPEYSDASHGSAVLSTIYLAKSLLIREYQEILQHGSQRAVASPARAHLWNVIRGFPEIVRFAFDWLFRGILATRKLPYTLIANADGSYPLEFNSEQIPLADNRVTLTKDTDALGVPRVHVDWQISEADIAAAKRAFEVLRDAIAATPDCRIEFDAAGLDDAIRNAVPVGGHHIGTTRMSATVADGVVDADCRVHGVANLFVASAAVFPTTSHANPTLTIVALSIRLADHLKQTLTA